MVKESSGYKPTYIKDEENKSILCLKCNTRSYLRLDYEERYCVNCGYHNDIENQKLVHRLGSLNAKI